MALKISELHTTSGRSTTLASDQWHRQPRDGRTTPVSRAGGGSVRGGGAGHAPGGIPVIGAGGGAAGLAGGGSDGASGGVADDRAQCSAVAAFLVIYGLHYTPR